MKTNACRPLLALLGLVPCAAFAHPAHKAYPVPPKLVVLVSIDQFRADYLTRFHDLFLPPRTPTGVGGFRYLMEFGAWFPDAHHDHLPLATGPGHAVHLTGAPPYKSGIVGNEWWDYKLGRSVYCVEDPASAVVGAPDKRGISPRNLLVTTVGDELKMATGRQARVFGIALKDRASVLMAGHLANAAYWFSPKYGLWVSSRYYRRYGTLPGWLNAVNAQKIPDKFFKRQWQLSKPLRNKQALSRLFTPHNTHAANALGMGTVFPHPLNGGASEPCEASYTAFTFSPYANDFVLNTAVDLIKGEQLGHHRAADILAINLSSNDYIGHTFGPDSAEVMDATVETDRALAHFINRVAATVQGGLSAVTIVVTADHGVAPIGAAMQEAGVPGGTWKPEAGAAAAQTALQARYGPGKYVFGYIEPYIWLNRELLVEKHVDSAEASHVAAAAVRLVPGIYSVYTLQDAMLGRLPPTRIGSRVAEAMNPQVSGDLLVVSMSGFYASRSVKGTSHGEPYNYDSRVPLLMAGACIRPGVYTGRASTRDISATLSFMLNIQPPSGCEGSILGSALLNVGAYAR